MRAFLSNFVETARAASWKLGSSPSFDGRIDFTRKRSGHGVTWMARTSRAMTAKKTTSPIKPVMAALGARLPSSESYEPRSQKPVMARLDRAIQGPSDKCLMRSPLDHRVKPDGDGFFLVAVLATLNRTVVEQVGP